MKKVRLLSLALAFCLLAGRGNVGSGGQAGEPAFAAEAGTGVIVLESEAVSLSSVSPGPSGALAAEVSGAAAGQEKDDPAGYTVSDDGKGRDMAEWYSRADRERMAQGLEPLEHSTLTEEDYRELVELALNEAVESSPARDLIGLAEVGDLEGKCAGVTTSETEEDGYPTGRYVITIDWGDKMQDRAADTKDGSAYVAQRLTSVFHEVRHVEQRAMLFGYLPAESRLDMEIATQMAVNSLYPTVYRRGYRNMVTEIDADVSGVEGALAFFDRHPELKDRYGFDFRKEIMRTDEYDVLEDNYQVMKATPEELLEGMRTYRDGAYDDPWLAEDAGRVKDLAEMDATESMFMERLEREYGVTWADLEKMDNDERNVLLIQNAMEVMDDPDARIARNLREYRDSPVMTGRFDEILRDDNDMEERVREAAGVPEPMPSGDAEARSAPSEKTVMADGPLPFVAWPVFELGSIEGEAGLAL